VSSTTTIIERKQIAIPDLPLAVYREIAAHLRQIKGVEVSIVEYDLTEGIFSPNSASIEELQIAKQKFSYRQSQVRGLCLECNQDRLDRSQQPQQEILAYYAQRYGNWIEFG
jgi:hypothetical protein